MRDGRLPRAPSKYGRKMLHIWDSMVLVNRSHSITEKLHKFIERIRQNWKNPSTQFFGANIKHENFVLKNFAGHTSKNFFPLLLVGGHIA